MFLSMEWTSSVGYVWLQMDTSSPTSGSDTINQCLSTQDLPIIPTLSYMRQYQNVK
jgi:hypothetical protein